MLVPEVGVMGGGQPKPGPQQSPSEKITASHGWAREERLSREGGT